MVSGLFNAIFCEFKHCHHEAISSRSGKEIISSVAFSLENREIGAITGGGWSVDHKHARLGGGAFRTSMMWRLSSGRKGQGAVFPPSHSSTPRPELRCAEKC